MTCHDGSFGICIVSQNDDFLGPEDPVAMNKGRCETT